MDELMAVLEARKLLAAINPASYPIPSERFAQAVSADIRYRNDFGENEPGFSFPRDGRWLICVNAEDSPGRQRFTICHEVAHIALKLPSTHGQEGSGILFVGKAPNEIACDRYAVELLLPRAVLKPLADRAETGIEAIRQIAAHFDASLTAAGIAYVTHASSPCALVVSEQGRIRYTVRSTPLREIRAWIPLGGPLPPGSASTDVRSGQPSEGPEPADPDRWFQDWSREDGLVEDAIHAPLLDQTLTLLWFEDEVLPPPKRSHSQTHREEDEEELGLKPLDGILPWPDKKRRR